MFYNQTIEINTNELSGTKINDEKQNQISFFTHKVKECDTVRRTYDMNAVSRSTHLHHQVTCVEYKITSWLERVCVRVHACLYIVLNVAF